MAGFTLRRREQAEERLDAGPGWTGEDLIFTSQTWTPILPRSFDRSLELVVRDAELPRLTSHGLRHTAATHMVANPQDLGELQAVSEILGHSVDILLRIYAHALPHAVRSVSDRIGERAGSRSHARGAPPENDRTRYGRTMWCRSARSEASCSTLTPRASALARTRATAASIP